MLWKSAKILSIPVPIASNGRWGRIGCTFRIHQFEGSFFSNSLRSNCSSSSANSVWKGKEYLVLSDEELMRQCEMDTFKASGPGGQHRNKRESAVRLKHIPTGITAQVYICLINIIKFNYILQLLSSQVNLWPFISKAVEDRSQHKNRASALARLRAQLALKGGWIVHACLFFNFIFRKVGSPDE